MDRMLKIRDEIMVSDKSATSFPLRHILIQDVQIRNFGEDSKFKPGN